MCGIPLTKGATYLYYAPKPVEFSYSSAAFVLTTIKEAFFFKLKIFYFEWFSKSRDYSVRNDFIVLMLPRTRYIIVYQITFHIRLPGQIRYNNNVRFCR